jgi:hypothetical protein
LYAFGRGTIRRMANTLATLITMTTYGTWLRGDRRGWVDDGKILPPDPILEAADRRRMKHPVYIFDRAAFNLTMPWHCRTTIILRIAINGMSSAFAIEDASMPLKMANEIAAFHQTVTSTDSVSQTAPLGATLAA